MGLKVYSPFPIKISNNYRSRYLTLVFDRERSGDSDLQLSKSLLEIRWVSIHNYNICVDIHQYPQLIIMYNVSIKPTGVENRVLCQVIFKFTSTETVLAKYPYISSICFNRLLNSHFIYSI